MADPTAPNEEQAQRWAGDEGTHWVAEADRYDAINAGFGEALLGAAALEPGEAVLDVGCGNGATTIEAARRVGSGGRVVGVDLSPQMLDTARARASAAGLDNVELVNADAQVHELEQRAFDVVMSRFGLMFFDDPDAAFANLGRSLRPGGRIAFTAWKGLMESEWIMVPGAAAAAHVGMPEGVEPNAPGPFGLADVERTRGILERAGFRSVEAGEVTRPIRVGDDADDAVAFIRTIPLVRDLLASAPPDKAEAAVEAAREALAAYEGPDGVVTENNVAWLVTAER